MRIHNPCRPVVRSLMILFLLLLTGEKAFNSDTGDMSLTISIGEMDNHGFESTSVEWTFDTWDKAVMNTIVTNYNPHSGNNSLKLDCHLTCTSPSNAGCAKWTLSRATNLYNKTISAYVWCPGGSGGRGTAPNGIQLYAKIGSDWRWKSSSWSNIGTKTNQWIYMIWPLTGNWAQTNIVEVGMKYSASGTCNITNYYSGPVFLDDFNW
ncbi:MAG: hypothetical protein PHF84_01710 [bacterium]|nr:hypothetical protein [bacterium]